jgi:hypothetical protein
MLTSGELIHWRHPISSFSPRYRSPLVIDVALSGSYKHTEMK